MSIPVSPVEFSADQKELWTCVEDLWALSLHRNPDEIRSTLHPGYVGWDMTGSLPHDREFAAQSVAGDAPVVTGYELKPLSVQVYDRRVGVVHYSYTATVVPPQAQPQFVTGKWTEVYLRQDCVWRMIAVSGRPNAKPTPSS